MSGHTPDVSDALDIAEEELPESLPRPELSPADLDTGPWGRVGAALLGGALVVAGLRRRSLGGMVLALAGGWLASRALGGSDLLETAEPETEADETEVTAGPMTVERSITVGEPADELSVLLVDPENLERIVGGLAEVTAEDEDRHRWTVRGPLDRELAWEMELFEDEPGEGFRWVAVDGAMVPTEWTVTYRPAPDDRGTELTLEVQIDPPGGELVSETLARFDVVPEAVVGTVLDRFKSLAETGEIPTQQGNPSARGRGDLV